MEKQTLQDGQEIDFYKESTGTIIMKISLIKLNMKYYVTVARYCLIKVACIYNNLKHFYR